MIKQGFSSIGNRPPLERPTTYAKTGIGSIYQKYRGTGPFTAPSSASTTYRVLYEAAGVEYEGEPPIDSNEYETGDSATVLGQGTLVYSGYVFAGWTDSVDTYSEGSSLVVGTSDVTLTPLWAPDLPPP